MYIIKLVWPPNDGHFKPDYFPRAVRYRENAARLVVEVAMRGGAAIIEKLKG